MHDTDTRAVIDNLNGAQRRSGLGKAEFARALGTSPSRYSTYRTGKTAPTAAFLFRANRIADALARARKIKIPTSIAAAESIGKALSIEGPLWAFTLTLAARDRARSILREHPDLAPAWEASASTGDQHWDTLFAALIGNEFGKAGLPEPRWTARTLDEAWEPVASLRLSPEQVREQTPEWLAHRNIFVAERDLATA